MRSLFLKSLSAIVVGSLMMVGSAIADPITGYITFSTPQGDSWTPVDMSWMATTIGSATGVSFEDNDNDGFNAQVDNFTGSFATFVTTGDLTNFANFQFNPTLDPSPVNPMWEVGGFSYQLDSIFIENQAQTLSLVGSGILTGNGFDPTAASFVFTGNRGTWSAVNEVPEPATMLLFGTGLIGLAGISARRKKAQK